MLVSSAKVFMMLVTVAVPGQLLETKTVTSYPDVFTKAKCEEELPHIVGYLDKRGHTVIFADCVEVISK